MKKYKLGVVGSRSFKEKNAMEEVLNEIIRENGKPEKIVSGAAEGADKIAEYWAEDNNISTIIHEPEYDKYEAYERKYKPQKERNSVIVNDSDMLVAFWDMKSTGTKDTIKKAKKKCIRIYIYNTLENKIEKMNP